MKSIIRLGGLVAVAWAVTFPGSSTVAQSYSIESDVIGLAAKSSAGAYSIEARILPMAPPLLSGGVFTLEVGDIGEVPVMVPDDVELLVSYSSGQVTLLWERGATGFILETAVSLGEPAPWTAVPGQLEANATHFFLRLNAPGEEQFFRLRHP